MKAAVCHAFGEPLSVEDVELRGPGSGEVSVQVAACAICHSDVAFMQGAWGGALPAVYGHEAAGIVAEVGPGVDAMAPGDHVVVTLVRSCGSCAQCLRGQPALCERLADFPLSRHSPLSAADGAPIHQGVRTGAFAERVTVDASQVVPIPADVPLEVASLLACGVITGVGAVRRTAGVEAGSSVVVFGTGGVGLNVVQGAVLAGAGTIVAVDLLDSKLEAARLFGATHTLNAGRDDVVAEIHSLTRGMGADYAFDASGSVPAIEQGAQLIRRGGTLVLVGLPPTGARVAFDGEAIADGALRILGSKVGSVRPQVDVPELVRLYREGRLKLDELISGRWPLEEINAAVSSAERGEALRPVIVF
jgi:S-(hydroxymethyl)glutathione dehydrogenase / alcohol dehydrogenase